MNRRGFFEVVGGLLSLIGLKSKPIPMQIYAARGRGEGVVQPGVFDMTQMPLPIVHKDFAWVEPNIEVINYYRRVRMHLALNGISPRKLTTDELDLWGRALKVTK